ncbi:MAG TPA: hypothetical protein PKG48_14065, partial [Bacteroidales bacterium]|nr:hypothetical protein [Bacteroidales bacterium]
MKHLLSLFLVLILWTGNAWATLNTYGFTSILGSYTTYSGGTVLGTVSNNEQVFNGNTIGAPPPVTGPGFPIGFVFNYNGMDCDVFAVNTNGWIVVGSSSLMLTIGGSTGNSTPISTTGPSGFKNAIVPVGMNLQGQSGSELSYLLDGVAPYRVLIIQWRSYRAAGASGENYNFQIKLFETTS